MQQHVAVGVGDQATVMGNTNATEGNEVALAKGVNVETVTYAHEERRP